MSALELLGYGEKGLRVFDFVWVRAERGWGAAASKGCVRIPASLDVVHTRRTERPAWARAH